MRSPAEYVLRKKQLPELKKGASVFFYISLFGGRECVNPNNKNFLKLGSLAGLRSANSLEGFELEVFVGAREILNTYNTC